MRIDHPTPPGPHTPDSLLAHLRALAITAETVEHKPVFTVHDGPELKRALPGGHTKNLFLKNKKDRMWLVVAEDHRPIDLKKLDPVLGSGRLSFGSADRLGRVLGVTPGSVTPFALINDRPPSVTVVLDAHMMRFDRLHFHPLVNTMTTAVAPGDLVRFIASCGHEPHILDLDPAAPDTPPA